MFQTMNDLKARRRAYERISKTPNGFSIIVGSGLSAFSTSCLVLGFYPPEVLFTRLTYYDYVQAMEALNNVKYRGEFPREYQENIRFIGSKQSWELNTARTLRFLLDYQMSDGIDAEFDHIPLKCWNDVVGASWFDIGHYAWALELYLPRLLAMGIDYHKALIRILESRAKYEHLLLHFVPYLTRHECDSERCQRWTEQQIG
jgi:hypothetical protein